MTSGQSRQRRAAASRLAVARALLCCLVAGAVSALADEFIPIDPQVAADGLDGDAIYRRMLENRFDSYEQRFTLRSGARSGSHHTVEIRLRYLSYRNEREHVVSKTLAKYLSPSDVRHLGYLVINKKSGPDDQFVYRPSARKVRRVNVRGEAIAGTDFSFEDVVPAELEDGRHHRLPDEKIDGTDVYVVAVVPRPESDSEYSKLVLYIEKQHFVPLQTVYWDNKRVEIKRLRAAQDSITLFEELQGDARRQIWIATRSRMLHLKLDSFTQLEIEHLDPNSGLRDRDFSERELTASR